MSVFAQSAFAVAILILLGYFLTALLWPPEVTSALKWVFALPVGAGICSILFIVFRRPMFTMELVLLLVSATTLFFFRQRRVPSANPLSTWRTPVSCLLLAAAVGASVAGMLVEIQHRPHGDWDATAIWTSHARYLFRDGSDWQRDIQHSFHADYPLLVPSMTARLWRYAGKEMPDMGGIVGMLFTLSGVGVLFGVLANVRDMTLAVLISLLLLGTPFYLEYGVSQSADVPLSLYILCTVALMYLHSKHTPSGFGLLGVAGFLAGCAGWTKNEGLLFILVIVTILLVRVLVQPQHTLCGFSAFLGGLLAPLAVILWFKLTVAPRNDLMENREYSELVAKLFNAARHVTIVENFSSTFWSFGNWIIHPVILLVFIALRGVDRETVRGFGWIGGVAALTMVLAGYYAVYLLTPVDLQTHLDSSLPRLFLQLWPTTLLLTGLVARREIGATESERRIPSRVNERVSS